MSESKKEKVNQQLKTICQLDGEGNPIVLFRRRGFNKPHAHYVNIDPGSGPYQEIQVSQDLVATVHLHKDRKYFSDLLPDEELPKGMEVWLIIHNEYKRLHDGHIWMALMPLADGRFAYGVAQKFEGRTGRDELSGELISEPTMPDKFNRSLAKQLSSGRAKKAALLSSNLPEDHTLSQEAAAKDVGNGNGKGKGKRKDRVQDSDDNELVYHPGEPVNFMGVVSEENLPGLIKTFDRKHFVRGWQNGDSEE